MPLSFAIPECWYKTTQVTYLNKLHIHRVFWHGIFSRDEIHAQKPDDLKTKTSQYDELIMEKRNYRHLDFDSSGQCFPHSRPLPRALCFGQLWLLDLSSVVLLCGYLHFSSTCRVATNTPMKLFLSQHFVVVDKFWRNHFILNLINSMGTKRQMLLTD